MFANAHVQEYQLVLAFLQEAIPTKPVEPEEDDFWTNEEKLELAAAEHEYTMGFL